MWSFHFANRWAGCVIVSITSAPCCYALHYQLQSRYLFYLSVCQSQTHRGLNLTFSKTRRSLFGSRVVRGNARSGAVAFTPQIYCVRRVTGTVPASKGASWTMPEHSTSVFTLIKWRRSKVQIQPLGLSMPRRSLLPASETILSGSSDTVGPKTCMLAWLRSQH